MGGAPRPKTQQPPPPWKEAVGLIHEAVLPEMTRSRGAVNGLGGKTQEPSLIRGGIDPADPSQLILRAPRCQVKNDPLARGEAAPEECIKSSSEALLLSSV